jgi:N-acetylneuraminic acid mutarotase
MKQNKKHRQHNRDNVQKENVSTLHFNDLQSENIPLTLQGHSMVSFGDSIYCFGGYNRTIEGVDTVHQYNRKKNSWKIVFPSTKISPSPRHYHSCSIYGDSMIIYGGYCQSDYYNDIFQFNFKTNEWKELSITKESTTRSYHQSIIYKDNLYLFGGKTSFLNYPNHMSVYNLKTFEYRIIDCRKDVGKSAHSMTIDKKTGIIYIFGGFKSSNKFDFFKQSNDTKQWMGDILTFDTNDELFREIKSFGSIPCIRTNHGCISIQDNVYIYGGFDLKLNDLKCFYEFNYLQKKWRKLNFKGDSPKSGLYSIVNMENDESHIFLFGGWTTQTLNRLYVTPINEPYIDIKMLQHFSDVEFIY